MKGTGVNMSKVVIEKKSEEARKSSSSGETTITYKKDMVTDETKNSEEGASDLIDVSESMELGIEEGSEELIEGSEELSEVVTIDANTLLEENIVDEVFIDPNYGEGNMEFPIYEEGMYMDPGFETGMAKIKDPLLSSWIFVIGISVIVLVVSSGLGALLAGRKIKKGIELYED